MKKLKPIIKTIKIKLCPKCNSELVKARPGYKCLECCYSWARPQKTDKQKLINKCDDLFSLIVRALGYCEVCHRSDIQLNGHHIKTRSIMILRYDFRNGCCLCVNCHEFSKDSVKNNPAKFLRWIQEHRPDDLKYVESKSELIAHYTILDYQEIYKELKAKLNEIQDSY